MVKKRLIEIPIFLLFIVSAFGAFVFFTSPDPKQLGRCFTTNMNQVELCEGSSDYVKLDEVSDHLRQAVLISEDVNFYHHKGFDFEETYLSLKKNIKEGRLARGGSTITQQLVKNAFLDPEKSFFRKLKEAYIAYQLEGIFSKDYLFEKYLNVVEFGPEVFGVKAASWYYFNKDPMHINPLEAAYLAQLLPSPKKYSATFVKQLLDKRSKKMIQLLIERMYQYKKINDTEYQYSLTHLENFPWMGLAFPEEPPEVVTPSYHLEGG